MATLILRPNSTSSAGNWIKTGGLAGTGSYTEVDEATLNEADYNSVSSYVSVGDAKLITKIGSTVYYSSSLAEDATTRLFSWECTTNPATSAAWTWDEIDALLSGVSSYIPSPLWQNILYGYPAHTTESGTINKVTFKSYIAKKEVKKVWMMFDYQTWVEVEYTEAAGWTHITKINGIASANISKINGIPVANISKVNGVAV